MIIDVDTREHQQCIAESCTIAHHLIASINPGRWRETAVPSQQPPWPPTGRGSSPQSRYETLSSKNLIAYFAPPHLSTWGRPPDPAPPRPASQRTRCSPAVTPGARGGSPPSPPPATPCSVWGGARGRREAQCLPSTTSTSQLCRNEERKKILKGKGNSRLEWTLNKRSTNLNIDIVEVIGSLHLVIFILNMWMSQC